MVRFFSSAILQSVFLTTLILSLISLSFAQVRTSSNYQVQSDSINIGGGLSSSTNFTQESTVGEIATGRSGSASYQLRAGYQQMQEVFLSMTLPTDVFMDTAIGGLTGGTSNGSTTFTVTTDSPAGYQVTISADDSPAMQHTTEVEAIADYDDLGTADATFNTAGSQAHFGYTVEGVDTAQYFLNDGGVCGSGVTEAEFTCWTGLAITSQTILRTTGANHPAGATTTINFRVGVGSGAGVVAGTYVATSTVTALPL